MLEDVLNWANGKAVDKVPSKETLNHRGLIELVSGLDVYRNTKEAYLLAYERLGIDIVNRVPLENAADNEGKTIRHPCKHYVFNRLGVYDTAFRYKYLCEQPEDIWEIDAEALEYDDLITPVPHCLSEEDIKRRQEAVGDIASYYPMLYTTLFMWAVEFFGWEVFMTAAITEPDKFYERFLSVFAKKTKKIVSDIAKASDCPFVFLHDDLADANGPLFPPSWYRSYIYPDYRDIFRIVKDAGKKVIFVADGNMESFFSELIEMGIDGIMFENPATDIDAVVEYFGQTQRFFIGGIDTAMLTNGTPEDVSKMVNDVYEKCGGYKGFAISSCGGIHGNIPLENLVAYFNARVAINATPEDVFPMSI
jgi:hypothetical protein